jgi:hypothetical protein
MRIFSTLRPRSPFDVLAVIASFVAMGGTAYAIQQFDSENIVDESLLSVDVRNDTLTGDDIDEARLDGARISGMRGPTPTYVHEQSRTTATGYKEVAAQCPAGQTILSTSSHVFSAYGPGDPPPNSVDTRGVYVRSTRSDGVPNQAVAVGQGLTGPVATPPGEAWGLALELVCSAIATRPAAPPGS